MKNDNIKPNYEFADRLIKLRKEAGKTQAEIAKVLGKKLDMVMDDKTYANYEQCRAKPSYEAIIALAEYYNTTTDYLLTGKTKSADSISINILIKGVDKTTRDSILDSIQNLIKNNTTEIY